MSSSLAVNITIGAVIASAFSSALGSAQDKIGKMGRALDEARRRSDALGKALSAGSALEAARAAGSSAAEIAKLEQAYEKAAAAASKYGVSVADWTREQQKASAEMQRLEKQIGIAAARQGERQKRRRLAGELAVGVAQAHVAAKPVRDAISFESAMADAAKTIDGMRDSTGKLTAKYEEMGHAVQEMGRSIPLAHAEIAALFAAGGQQGINDVKELREFATLSAQMAVSFGMGAQEAADAIGGYRSAMGLSFEQTRAMLDLMNQFANTTSASEQGIADIVRRIGSLGGVAGVQNRELTAMAATLDAMKIAPEVAATSLKNFFLALAAGGAATDKQKKAFASLSLDAQQLAKSMQADAPRAILQVLEALRKLPKEEQLATMKNIFGKESLGGITPLLSQLDVLRGNLEKAKDETGYLGAMEQEFNNRNATTAAALTTFNNQLAEISVTLGTTLLPAVNGVLEAVKPGIAAVAQFIADHPKLTNAITGITAGYLAAIPVIKFFGIVISSVKSATLIAEMAKASGGMAKVGEAAAAAMPKISTLKTALAAPVRAIPLVAALGTLIAALVGIGKALDAVTDKLLGAGSAAKLNDLDDKAHATTDDGRGLHDMSDAEIMDLAGAASGGIVTRPTVLMAGEGGESEAILPLSRLEGLLQKQRQPAVAPVNVNFSPNIQVATQGDDAYAQVSRALNEGAASLRREMERMMQDQRRLAYF